MKPHELTLDPAIRAYRPGAIAQLLKISRARVCQEIKEGHLFSFSCGLKPGKRGCRLVMTDDLIEFIQTRFQIPVRFHG